MIENGIEGLSGNRDVTLSCSLVTGVGYVTEGLKLLGSLLSSFLSLREK